MKAGKDDRVPLSGDAIAILTDMARRSSNPCTCSRASETAGR